MLCCWICLVASTCDETRKRQHMHMHMLSWGLKRKRFKAEPPLVTAQSHLAFSPLRHGTKGCCHGGRVQIGPCVGSPSDVLPEEVHAWRTELGWILEGGPWTHVTWDVVDLGRSVKHPTPTYLDGLPFHHQLLAQPQASDGSDDWSMLFGGTCNPSPDAECQREASCCGCAGRDHRGAECLSVLDRSTEGSPCTWATESPREFPQRHPGDPLWDVPCCAGCGVQHHCESGRWGLSSLPVSACRQQPCACIGHSTRDLTKEQAIFVHSTWFWSCTRPQPWPESVASSSHHWSSVDPPGWHYHYGHLYRGGYWWDRWWERWGCWELGHGPLILMTGIGDACCCHRTCVAASCSLASAGLCGGHELCLVWS